MKELILTLFLFCWSSLIFSDVVVKVNPSTIQLNDSFQVTITFDHIIQNDTPNLSPLLKDFDILSTERSVSYSDVNGKISSISQWALILRPKKTGTLIIPPISIGKEQSLANQVIVTDNEARDEKRDSTDLDAKQTMLEVSVDESAPFINQQVTYTVKLINRQRLFDAQYRPPEVLNSLIIPLGEGQHSEIKINGLNFAVEEQRYAIFPQKNGQLTIVPPSFSAYLYDGFTPTRLNIKGKPVVLEVKSLPSEVNIDNWLVASKVKLKESFVNLDDSIQEGDTFIRVIKVEATGAVAQLLPKLNFSNNENYNVYVDKPEIKNTLHDGRLRAVATYKITYLLKKPGQLNLSPINVSWFNTVTNKYETTSLAMKKIDVKPKIMAVKSNLKPAKLKKKFILKQAESKIATSNHMRLILLGIIAFIFFVLIFKLRVFNLKSFKTSRRVAYVSLQKACKNNDPIAARIELLNIARLVWPHLSILNLNDIPIINIEFTKELNRLSLAIYSKDKKINWCGKNLWCIFRKLKLQKGTIKKLKKDLPPTYL